MQWCSVYFEWVRVALLGIQLTPAVSNVSSIYQINLFPLDTAAVFSPCSYTGYQLIANPVHHFP